MLKAFHDLPIILQRFSRLYMINAKFGINLVKYHSNIKKMQEQKDGDRNILSHIEISTKTLRLLIENSVSFTRL